MQFTYKTFLTRHWHWLMTNRGCKLPSFGHQTCCRVKNELINCLVQWTQNWVDISNFFPLYPTILSRLKKNISKLKFKGKMCVTTHDTPQCSDMLMICTKLDYTWSFTVQSLVAENCPLRIQTYWCFLSYSM